MNALITGGSRGIGFAISQCLAKKGLDLLLVSKNENNLKNAKNNLAANSNVSVDIKVCDLKNKKSINRLIEYCIKSNKVPEFLVLNAGIYIEGSVSESEDADFQQTMDVNLNASYYLVKKLLPQMKNLNMPRIVLIGSTAAYEAYPLGSLYGVSKWALRGYAVNLRSELKSMGIGVTFVAPGGTWTDLWKGENLPKDRLLLPNDVGKLVASLTELSPQAVVEEIIVRPILGDIHE